MSVKFNFSLCDDHHPSSLGDEERLGDEDRLGEDQLGVDEVRDNENFTSLSMMRQQSSNISGGFG